MKNRVGVKLPPSAAATGTGHRTRQVCPMRDWTARSGIQEERARCVLCVTGQQGVGYKSRHTNVN